VAPPPANHRWDGSQSASSSGSERLLIERVKHPNQTQ
jgi:hypothetical protein